MFRRHYNTRRSTNIVFVIFRLLLSLVILSALLGGIYAAYKDFSGLDPLKLDLQAIISQALAGKIPAKLLDIVPKDKIIPVDPEEKTTLFTFALIADSHNDNQNLKKALEEAKERDSAFVIGLGDYTDVGTKKEMLDAKEQLDSNGLRYFLTAGDHDLWDCRNRSQPPNCNFKEVFGPSYQSFDFEDFKFILLYNSDNYVGIDGDQISWLNGELEKAKALKGVFVFLHKPLFHPSSDHVMGMVEGKLKEQAKGLIFTLKEAGVKKIFAGDIHYFSQYDEPTTNLSMVTVGALTIERNPQAPRFAIVSVYSDATTRVDDISVK